MGSKIDASIPPLKDGDGIGARHVGVCSLPRAPSKVHCAVPVRPVLPSRPTPEIRSCSQGVLPDPFLITFMNLRSSQLTILDRISEIHMITPAVGDQEWDSLSSETQP